jgi:hypothetical protein
MMLMTLSLHQTVAVRRASIPESLASQNGNGPQQQYHDGISQVRRRHRILFSTARGGDGGAAASFMSQINDYIGASKQRCWVILLCSILIDTMSTTLMKSAQVESSFAKLILAFVGYFIR